MPLIRTQIETRVRQRIQAIYNNDFDTFIDNLINAKIDEIVSRILNENVESIVTRIMLDMPEIQDRLKNAATIR